MARSLFSRFLSGTAGLVLALLSACGGGDDATNQVANPLITAAKAPDTGLTFDGQPRKKALAAGAPTPEITFTVSEGMAALSERKILAAGKLFGGVSIEETLNWAEEQFPSLFPHGPVSGDVVFRDVAYTYRYYPGLEHYLGITPEGYIFGYGSFTGLTDQVRPYGHIRDWACQIAPTKCGVVAVEPADGATGVDFRSATIRVTYNVRLESCTAMSDRVVFGAIAGTASCVNEENGGSIITIVPDRLPVGTTLTGSIRNQRDTMGYPVSDFTWSFTTRNMVVAEKLYVGNFVSVDVRHAMSAIDVATGTVKPIEFPGVPGFSDGYNPVWDPVSATLFVGPRAGFHLYLVDPETDRFLSSIVIDPPTQYTHIHGIRGLTLVPGNRVCGAFARISWLSYIWQNRAACWNTLTGERVFLSDSYFLGDATQIPMGVKYDSVTNKVYVTVASLAGFPNDGSWSAGTSGELRVLNSETLSLERIIPTGSVPVDFSINRLTGEVFVLNGGDRTVTVYDPRNGAVETIALPGYSGLYDRPTGIVVNGAGGYFAVTDSKENLVVYSLANHQEVKRVPAGQLAGRVALIRDRLYVTSLDPSDAFGFLTEIDADTLVVTRVLGGLGRYPFAIVGVPGP